MDLLLHRDPNTPNGYDMAFENGECPTTTDMVDRTTQRLYIRLKTLLGEWFLNESYGVPYLERILGHKPKKSTVDMILQTQIMLDPEVKQIISFSSTLTPQTRIYSCRFRVKVEDGTTSSEIVIT